jgi:hypothetical protein
MGESTVSVVGKNTIIAMAHGRDSLAAGMRHLIRGEVPNPQGSIRIRVESACQVAVSVVCRRDAGERGQLRRGVSG